MGFRLLMLTDTYIYIYIVYNIQFIYVFIQLFFVISICIMYSQCYMYEKPFEQKHVICVCLLFRGVAFLVRHHLTAVLGEWKLSQLQI